MAEKRVQMDLLKIYKDPPPGVSASPTDTSIMQWNVLLNGPEATPFEGGIFKIRMEFPSDYPNRPPNVFFYSKMFHPNVYSNGRICLDILQIQGLWNPEYDARSVLFGIQAMLGDPNPDSPANVDAKNLFMTNTMEYEKNVKRIVDLSIADSSDVLINKIF